MTAPDKQNTIVLIPSRLGSSRLPNKPLADIAGKSMIVRCYLRARKAGVGPVVVACAEQEIVDEIESVGGLAVLTDPDLPSGSDRVAAALKSFDPERRYQRVVNVQGDLPALDPALIRRCAGLLDDPAVDIGTLVSLIRDPSECVNPNVVKAVVAFEDGSDQARILYFSRAQTPWCEEGKSAENSPLYHHIGLYSYQRSSLERFVALKPSPLEKRESLEQLRALEAGMRIDGALVDTVFLGVDTAEDLEKARAFFTAPESVQPSPPPSK